MIYPGKYLALMYINSCGEFFGNIVLNTLFINCKLMLASLLGGQEEE